MRKNDLESFYKSFQAKFWSNSTHLKGLGVDGGLDDVHHHLRWDRVRLQVEGTDGFVRLKNSTVIFQTQYLALLLLSSSPRDNCRAGCRSGRWGYSSPPRTTPRSSFPPTTRTRLCSCEKKDRRRSKLATRTSLVFYRVFAYIVTLGFALLGTFERHFLDFTMSVLLPRWSGAHIQ